MSAENTILVISENGDDTKKQIKKDNLFRLNEVNWMINVTPMSDSHRDTIESRTILQLKTTHHDTPSTTIMDFKLEEMSKFFQTLEDIQNKLDDLVKTNESNDTKGSEESNARNGTCDT